MQTLVLQGEIHAITKKSVFLPKSWEKSKNKVEI